MGRTIVETDEFTESARAIQPDARRWDEQLWAIMWTIARNPEESSIVVKSHPHLRLIFTPKFPDLPALRILFTIDGPHQCTLHAVGIAEDDEDVDVIG